MEVANTTLLGVYFPFHSLFRTGVFLLNEVFCRRYEIIKDVLFILIDTSFMPRITIFTEGGREARGGREGGRREVGEGRGV